MEKRSWLCSGPSALQRQPGRKEVGSCLDSVGEMGRVRNNPVLKNKKANLAVGLIVC